MEALISGCLSVFAIAIYVNPKLCSWFWGLWAAAMTIHTFWEPKNRANFFAFHRTYRVWMIVVLIPIVTGISILWSLAPFKNCLHVWHKYLHFLVILVVLPYFTHHPACVQRLLKSFVWISAFYCLYTFWCGGVGVWFAINPSFSIICGSVYIACILSFVTLNILTKDANVINLTQLIFFTIYLFLVNGQRTGSAASVLSLFILCAIATIHAVRNRKISAESKKKAFKNVIWVCGIRFAIVVLACRLFAPLYTMIVCKMSREEIRREEIRREEIRKEEIRWEEVRREEIRKRIDAVLNQYPFREPRSIMIICGWINYLYKPIDGWGLGSYPVLATNYWPKKKIKFLWLSHHEWLLWMVEFGIFGALLLIFWFGWVARFLWKNRGYCPFYASYGGIFQVIFLFSGCCDGMFHPIGVQSVYVLGTCSCIAMIEHEKLKKLRKTV